MTASDRRLPAGRVGSPRTSEPVLRDSSCCGSGDCSVVSCGGGGLALYFGFPEHLRDHLPAFVGGMPSELRYMPTGTTFIHFERVDQINNSKFSKEVGAVLLALRVDERRGDFQPRATATGHLQRIRERDR